MCIHRIAIKLCLVYSLIRNSTALTFIIVFASTPTSAQTYFDSSNYVTHSLQTPLSGRHSEVSFDIDPKADCFVVYVHDIDYDNLPFKARLTSPDGFVYPKKTLQDYYVGEIIEDGWISRHPYESNEDVLTNAVAIPMPMINSLGGKLGGRWKLDLSYTSSYALSQNVSVAQRIGYKKRLVVPNSKPPRYILNLTVVLYVENKDDIDEKISDIELAIKKLQSVYAQASITVNYDRVFQQIAEPDAPPLKDDFGATTKDLIYGWELYDAITYDMPDTSAMERVILVFAEGLRLTTPGALAKTGGIPGPQGFESSFGAVLIRYPTSPNDPIKVNGLLGTVAAHELGHYLGLTHLSAKNDHANLMFPVPNRSSHVLNEEQIFILQHMPIVSVK